MKLIQLDAFCNIPARLESGSNHTSWILTFLGEKFNILPPDIQKLFVHVVSLAEAAAESTEDTIEEEQNNVRGFLKNFREKARES
ncbi:MAG: hypothetical protein WA667_25520 [Candidatus Nitrosopolaris sp.]